MDEKKRNPVALFSSKVKVRSFGPYLDLKVQAVNLLNDPEELAQSYRTFIHAFLHTNCTETPTACKHASAAISFSLAWFPHEATQKTTIVLPKTGAKVRLKKPDHQSSRVT